MAILVAKSDLELNEFNFKALMAIVVFECDCDLTAVSRNEPSAENRDVVRSDLQCA